MWDNRTVLGFAIKSGKTHSPSSAAKYRTKTRHGVRSPIKTGTSWPFHLRTPGTDTTTAPVAAPSTSANHVPWWPFLAAGAAIVLAAALSLARRRS